jgi:hypothetical protein
MTRMVSIVDIFSNDEFDTEKRVRALQKHLEDVMEDYYVFVNETQEIPDHDIKIEGFMVEVSTRWENTSLLLNQLRVVQQDILALPADVSARKLEELESHHASLVYSLLDQAFNLYAHSAGMVNVMLDAYGGNYPA